MYWSPAFKQGIGEWGKYWPYMVLHAVSRSATHQTTHRFTARVEVPSVSLVRFLAILVDVFVRWDGRFVVSFYNPNEKFWNALAFAQMAGYVTIAAVLLNHPKVGFGVLLKGVAIASSVILVVKSGTRGQFVLMAALPIVFLPMSRPLGSYENVCVGCVLVICLAAASIFAYDSFTHQDERWSSDRVPI